MWPFGIGNKYPYTDFHELNTDYLIEKTGKIDQNLKDSENAREGAEAAQAAAETAQAAAETAQAAAENAQEGAETAEENTEEYYNNLQTHIADDVTNWLTANVDPVGSAVVVDSSLSISGAAADSKVTGINIRELTSDLYGRSGFVVEQGSVNVNTGAVSENPNYCRTSAIEITENTNYTLTVKNNTTPQISVVAVYYDSTNTVIGNTTIGWAYAGNNTYTITSMEGSNYVRFRFSYYPLNAITPSAVNVSLLNPAKIKNAFDHYYNNVLVNNGNITEPGLNLNTGMFIHSGSWSIADVNNIPLNYPSNYIGRIVVIATESDSTFSTFQIVIDNTDTMYYRYSNTNNNWLDWKRIATYNEVTFIRDSSLFNYGNITTADLDLNIGDFIHPGMWAVNDTTYTPAHTPTNQRCRIISYASSSDNTIYTYQIVIDITGKVFKRFSSSNMVWSPWVSDTALHDDIAFKCLFIDNETFINSNVITQDSSSTNRVQTLMGKWNAVTLASGIEVEKTILGKDASNTFDIFNYKVSNGVTGKPVVLVVFGEHGNEYNSAEIGSYFYKEIANGVMTKYLKYVDFWLIPLMNPWGYENKQRNNYNDVNLNRDFPCEWNYYTVEHNKTDNFSLSQPETQYLYNLLVNNRNKILFMINKHNTGSISNKININEEDIVGYTATVLKSDTIFNEGLTMWQDAQVRQTDPWIDTDCNVDISEKPVIVNRRNLVTDGSMDLFANSIGIHGSLIEVCGAANFNTDTVSHYSSQHLQDLARLELDFIVNYVSKAIENNEVLLSSDDLQMNLTYKTRVRDGNVIPIAYNVEQGSVNTNTGAISDNPNYCRTTPIEIPYSHDIDAEVENTQNKPIGIFAIFYDANNNFISSKSIGSVPAGDTVTFNISPTSNTKYIRLRFQFNPVSEITPSMFLISGEISAWKNVEQYWNGNQLVNI